MQNARSQKLSTIKLWKNEENRIFPQKLVENSKVQKNK
jgi:hypothetical protein